MQKDVAVKIALVGVGSGFGRDLTCQAARLIEQSDCLIGARRLLDNLPHTEEKRKIAAVKPDAILAALTEESYENAVVLFSGDAGFYSGCRSLLPRLRELGVTAEVLPGISSVQLLSAALQKPWQDWILVSAHGVACNPLAAVMQGRPALFLTGGQWGPASLCARLTQAGLGTLKVAVGEQLGSSLQKILECTAAEAAERQFDPLSVLLVEPAPVGPRRVPGWPDSWFVRGKVPMTKQLVRSAVLSLLAPKDDAVIWDIGAGTGSVSVELAAIARQGTVYAVECEADACALIRQNRARFCAWNLCLVEGKAPQVLESLPAPDVVFVGGSKGEMDGILEAILAKNPSARICVSAIALETVNAAMKSLERRNVPSGICQLGASVAHHVGKHHLMMANNPIFLITGNCDD